MIDVNKLSVRAKAAYRIAERLSSEYKEFGSWLPGQFETYVEMCDIVAEETNEYWQGTGEGGPPKDE